MIQKIKRLLSKKQRSLKTAFALGVSLLVAGVGVYMLFKGQAESFCDINPADDTLAIEAAINGCADGSTIRFPAGASYVLNDTIFVKDRHNLVIDGRNSTFTITTDGETKPSINRIAPGYNENSINGGNWMLLRGSNITLKNIRAIGSFPPGLNGEARDIQKENSPEYISDHDGDGRFRYSESMSNFGVYGTDGAYLEDLYGKAPWGDTVTAATDYYVDNFYGEHGGETRQEGSNTVHVGNYAKNIVVTRVRSEEPSRMCFAFTSGRIITVQDSYCKSAWYGGTDQEIDNVQQPLESVYFLRNTFDGFNLFGYLLPVAGDNISDIRIKDNTFITPPDASCNPTIGMGGYPDILSMIKGSYIENNTIVSYGTAIQLDSVAGGTVKNNKITTITKEGVGCGSSAGPAPLVVISSRSTNVVVENNGPNAPGAGGTVTPPADSVSPTVAISSPSSGATVSGAIVVNANASDNIGVTKVEFLIDGTLKSTDTSSPYSFNWNTTTSTNGTHTISAKAYDAAGNDPTVSSGVSVTVNNSASAADTTPPGAASNLKATIASNPNRINLTWTAATDNVGVTKYYVVRNGTTLASLGNVTNYSDQAVSTGVNYSYNIIAEDAAGNSGPKSSTAAATIPPPPGGNQHPAAPTNLQATAVSSSQINLTWTAATDDKQVIYYHIWRNGAKIADVHFNTGTTSFGDSTVQPGVTYSYYIKASDAEGAVGPASATKSVATPGGNSPPAKPGDINRDGKVNFDDALAVIRKWNQSDAEADVNKDNKVNFDDALLIIRNWRN